MNEIDSSPGLPIVSIDGPRPTAVWITLRVRAMQVSFYQPEMSDEVAALAMSDWITILGDIPQAAIERAFTGWLTSEDRRPTPAAIRKRALAHVTAPVKPMGQTVKKIFEEVYGAPTAAELERRREIAFEMGMDQYAPSAEVIDLARRREAARG